MKSFSTPAKTAVKILEVGLAMGMIVSCLTGYFAYGAKLEENVEGLV